MEHFDKGRKVTPQSEDKLSVYFPLVSLLQNPCRKYNWEESLTGLLGSFFFLSHWNCGDNPWHPDSYLSYIPNFGESISRAAMNSCEVFFCGHFSTSVKNIIVASSVFGVVSTSNGIIIIELFAH